MRGAIWLSAALALASAGCCGGKKLDLAIDGPRCEGTLSDTPIAAGAHLRASAGSSRWCFGSSGRSVRFTCPEAVPNLSFASSEPAIVQVKGPDGALLAVGPGKARLSASGGGFGSADKKLSVEEPKKIRLSPKHDVGYEELPDLADGAALVASTVLAVDSSLWVDKGEPLCGAVPFAPQGQGVSLEADGGELALNLPMLLRVGAAPGPASLSITHRKATFSASFRVIRPSEITTLGARVVFHDKKPTHIALSPAAGAAPALGAAIQATSLTPDLLDVDPVQKFDGADARPFAREAIKHNRVTLIELRWKDEAAAFNSTARVKLSVEGSPMPPVELPIAAKK